MNKISHKTSKVRLFISKYKEMIIFVFAGIFAFIFIVTWQIFFGILFLLSFLMELVIETYDLEPEYIYQNRKILTLGAFMPLIILGINIFFWILSPDQVFFNNDLILFFSLFLIFIFIASYVMFLIYRAKKKKK